MAEYDCELLGHEFDKVDSEISVCKFCGYIEDNRKEDWKLIKSGDSKTFFNESMFKQIADLKEKKVFERRKKLYGFDIAVLRMADDSKFFNRTLYEAAFEKKDV